MDETADNVTREASADVLWARSCSLSGLWRILVSFSFTRFCFMVMAASFWLSIDSGSSSKVRKARKLSLFSVHVSLAKHCNTCLFAFKSTTAARSCVCCSVLWIRLISKSQTHNSCNTVVLQSECCLRSQPPSWIVNWALLWLPELEIQVELFQL